MGRSSSSSESSSSSSSSGSSDSDSGDNLKRRRSDDRDEKKKRKRSRTKESRRDSDKHHSSKDKKSKKEKKHKKKHKKHKKEHKERKHKDDGGGAKQKVEDYNGALNPIAAAAFEEKQSWKKTVLEAAARAKETLASGELQRQKQEMNQKHNAFGGDAVDWRAKKKLNKQVQAQKRMVQVGQQLLEKEKAEKARMRELLMAVGVPVEDAGPSEAELAAEAARKAAAKRAAREQRERMAKMKGPAPPPGY
uniref:Uncharacterized protein n=1 Tax=Pyramimonas obovata TaxID=1411642 RepID=A0A7S0RQU6_9CHLO|mmetsp:Transcript_4141/g.8501  ORF Transcript_4141/g.8501 Transcript_4141/m.8501 type:complete len:249 (+) Transcript_4141:310-1056(+)|eukprot:CAMPEP_0118947726 /NCGR_PEP_ID=MMETSP1169-20130426/46557_1 /TAXON_ID=36882 /ORGANISM="Pyramimonas obovata, Strain CCMP722" /LENGTH=248 /DNA_ID=CAMNT_0006893995 /DNA_START=255 /DNA_END=1001 /DNA_ORIENTATION=+